MMRMNLAHIVTPYTMFHFNIILPSIPSLRNNLLIQIFTERHGRVGNTPAFYSEGPEFKFRPGD
jgi:hypothetical protein